MQRLLINAVNCTLLILILIGIPAITHKQFWNWQISSTSTAQNLMFGGLIFATVMNILAATIFMTSPKPKELSAKWSFIFGALLFLEYAFVHGWFNFEWLKKSLLWLQNHF
jgi:hypothetical protein